MGDVAEQMIGNAVPVKLGQYVANCILQYIEGSSNATQVMKKQLELFR